MPGNVPPLGSWVFPVDRVPYQSTFTTVTFTGNHPDPGVTWNAYKLYRKNYTSGVTEYWNGTIWTATVTEMAITPVAIGTQINVTTVALTANTVYELGFYLKDNNGNITADPSGNQFKKLIAVPKNVRTIVVTQPAAAPTSTRPRVSWTLTGSTSAGLQAFWRIIVRETNSSGPIVWDSGYRFDPFAVSAQIEFDLSNGHTYVFGVIINDDRGIAIGTTYTAPFTATLNLPASPSITATPNTTLGTMDLEVISGFNFLDPESSDFGTSIGVWADLKNANSSRDPAVAISGVASLRIDAAGKSYGFLDTESGTYGNEDTLYATYNDEIISQEP